MFKRLHHPAMPRRYCAELDSGTILLASALKFAQQIVSANAAKTSADFQAEIFRQQATQARQRAAVEGEAARRRARADIARLRARSGGRGVNPNVGSPLLAQGDIAAVAERDALRISHFGGLRARELEANATEQRFRGTTRRNTTLLGAGASLLSDINKSISDKPDGES